MKDQTPLAVQPSAASTDPAAASLHQRTIGVAGWGWGGLLLLSTVTVFWLVGTARPASCKRNTGNYVGAHRCRGCHAQAYKKWSLSAHAKGFKQLPAKHRNTAACLRCHSTGTAKHLQGVQCESCHGPGRYYIRPEVMVDPLLARSVGLRVKRNASGCTSCHTKQVTKGKSFNYKKEWAKIAHGNK